MKKLLLITNLFLLASLAGSCQSTPKTATSKKAKSGGSTTSSGTAGTGGSIKKDTLAKSSGTAIIHSSPNQAQTDSLKKAKNKSKK